MSKYPGRIVTDLAPAGYSVYFDGTGDYLNASPTALGSGNFTIECWAYLTGSVASKGIFHVATSSVLPGTVSGVAVASGASGGWTFYYNNGTQNTNTSLTAALNTWIHIAVVKSSTTISLYINGILNQSQTDTANYTNQVAAIGGFFSTAYLMTGNISNFRMVNSALYSGTSTTTANFNLPTQLFNITNTSLLTCNSPAIIDQSNNAFAITTNGNAAVSTLTPFRAYVPYNPALGASTPGVWTVDEALQAKGTRQWNMYDPSFNLTTLLLHGNGTNTAQNNTFLDSSSNNFTITRNGNTTQGSFSPFSLQPGYWGNYFGGAGSYATSTSTAIATTTTTFTIEGWIYPTATPISTSNIPSTICDGLPAGVTLYWGFGPLANGTLSFYWYDGTAKSAVGNTVIALNTWTHIAVSVNANAITLYVNGVQQTLTGTTTLTNRSGSTATPIAFAQWNTGVSATGSLFTGYISNFSILSGTAKYSTTFTPTTAPLPTGTTNQVLLFAYANRFVDSNTATTAKTFTLTGTPSVQAFSPFYSTAAYTPATVGGSGYFDGSGDYLTIADDAAFEMTADFTLELWFYCTQLPASTLLGDLLTKGASGVYQPYYIFIRDTGSVVFYSSSTGTSWDIASNVSFGTPPLNSWNHVAVSRSGSNIRMFLNGALVQTINNAASGNALTDNTRAVAIGARSDGTEDKFYGYISNVRIIKGVAVYTGAFTPPRAPLATSGAASASAYSSTTNVNTSFAASATSLLVNFTNAGITDATAKNVLETVGNAQISTTQSKFGGSSMLFDGAAPADNLRIPSSPITSLGSGSWTIEFWVYRVGSGNQILYDQRSTATQVAVTIFNDGTNVLRFFVNGTNQISDTNTFPLTTWTHVAVCKSGSSTRMFVNGTQVGSTYADTNTYVNNPIFIGSQFDSTGLFNGYIDDLRVTLFARYTGNFTPQTSQWQDE